MDNVQQNGVPKEFGYRETYNMQRMMRQWEGIAQSNDDYCPINPTIMRRNGSSSALSTSSTSSDKDPVRQNGLNNGSTTIDIHTLKKNLTAMMGNKNGDPDQQDLIVQLMTKVLANQMHSHPPEDPAERAAAQAQCPFFNGGEMPSGYLTPSSQGSTTPSLDCSISPGIDSTSDHAFFISPEPNPGPEEPPVVSVTAPEEETSREDIIDAIPQKLKKHIGSLEGSRSQSLTDLTMSMEAQGMGPRRRSSLALARARASGSRAGSRRGSAVNSRFGSTESLASDCGSKTGREPVKLNFYVDEKSTVDTLHLKTVEKTYCTNGKCLGSVMFPPPKRPYGNIRSKEDKIIMADDFYNQYFESLKKLNSLDHKVRIKEVRESIEKTGLYDHTYDELVFGAKQAWRNAPRCIGRIQWTRLEVFDARDAKTPQDMYDAMDRHLEYSTNGGNLRSAITVFPMRTNDAREDFRVWNSQFIRYCGYRQPDGSIIGDPAGVEFTEVCQKLGWKGKNGRFDIPPLVLQARGGKPELFELPKDLSLEVELSHPTYEWFKDLGLRWYAVPGVSNMLFDCGGMEYCAAPFSGWYMSTEVGSRDLCDPQRYNVTLEVAERMGLDTSTTTTLWKDKAVVEVNLAVLHSYKEAGVTIQDHHSAAESFMQHFANETKARGGCPADWVWINPPMSSNLTPVYHQEMLTYFMKPSYEYQDKAWDNYDFSGGTEWRKDALSLRALAIALRFTSSFMSAIRRRRTKAVVLYATETARSQVFAGQLAEMLDYAFNSRALCMEDYDAGDLKNEALVYFVASTFGDGDPPENGRSFFSQLSAMAKSAEKDRKNKGYTDETFLLKNVQYSVFALGSRAYPHYCKFGKDLDRCMQELKGQRLNALVEGDELGGQEQAFKQWSGGVYKTAIKTHKVKAAPRLEEITGAMRSSDVAWAPNKFRVRNEKGEPTDLVTSLTTVHKRVVKNCSMVSTEQLQSNESDRRTVLVKICDDSATLSYEPGDHLGVHPANRADIVESVLEKLDGEGHPDHLVALEMNYAEEDKDEEWEAVKKLPPMTLRTALTHFLDITTPPSSYVLRQLAGLAKDIEDTQRLMQLAEDPEAYDTWRYDHWPHLGEVLEEFSSIKVPTSFLLSQLSILQPRYYSISSAPVLHSNEIHTTVAVVEYRTQDGNGKHHYGVCSSWLERVPDGSDVPCFIRKAPSFKLPEDPTKPVIMVGPGSGIAPLRSFWQHRYCEKKQGEATGEMTLLFGCRHPDQDDIYRKEIEAMQQEGVLTKVLTGYSRLSGQPKTYVQHLLEQNASQVFEQLVEDEGHFYVCGDVNMAADVKTRLINIIMSCGEATEDEAKECLQILREEGRFHEDIYGAVFRPNTSK